MLTPKAQQTKRALQQKKPPQKNKFLAFERWTESLILWMGLFLYAPPMIFRNVPNPSVVCLLYLVSVPVLSGSVARLRFVMSEHAGTVSHVDQRYLDHPYLTVLHLVPGIVFFLLGPLQFAEGLRKVKGVHRVIGRMFILSAVISGLGVLLMVLAFPALGGLLTQVSTFGIISAQFVFLGIAWHAIRQRNLALHRAYMIRAFALGLSVSTARIVIESAAFLWGTPFEQVFVPASIIGVLMNVILAEALIAFGQGTNTKRPYRETWRAKRKTPA
jgi:uncharacterized membrane protein YozB (DUF420 family)